jgi:hypothetical protein
MTENMDESGYLAMMSDPHFCDYSEKEKKRLDINDIFRYSHIK